MLSFWDVFPSLYASFSRFRGGEPGSEECVWKWITQNFTSLFTQTAWNTFRSTASRIWFLEILFDYFAFSRSTQSTGWLACSVREGILMTISATHLQFRFGYVDLAAVHKLDNELKVGERHFGRHDYDRMFARILYKELLKECGTSWQHHLQRKIIRISWQRRFGAIFLTLWHFSEFSSHARVTSTNFSVLRSSWNMSVRLLQRNRNELLMRLMSVDREEPSPPCGRSRSNRLTSDNCSISVSSTDLDPVSDSNVTLVRWLSAYSDSILAGTICCWHWEDSLTGIGCASLATRWLTTSRIYDTMTSKDLKQKKDGDQYELRRCSEEKFRARDKRKKNCEQNFPVARHQVFFLLPPPVSVLFLHFSRIFQWALVISDGNLLYTLSSSTRWIPA